ncbi:AT-rich interactive domain-containing protein 4B-like isoform X1 [Euwallacea fornicatus]|uniref:AT-rich interactive domain-containing protein 4B-like isoform X1 n=1 Tax=Euwallacea fornicatus TaxID=995702 RepID=UPI003390235E
MQVDDPPYLSVGTAVSAKYKGAFCEAKVSKVDRVVKCKVTFKQSGLGGATVSDNEIRGTLRVGQQVLVKHLDHKELVEATITKIQDCSQYTVVFDDGDITTLRRTALCLKSGRHFNESESLDQLPLTHPEHFGIPVMGGRKGRKNKLLKSESSDEELEDDNEPGFEGYSQDIGRVVSVETGENKRGREKWFPGLIVIPSAQPTVKINTKNEFLIRSFRDDRYYTVPKKEVSEFKRDEKIDSPGLLEAMQKTLKYLDSNELPLHWEKSSLFNVSADSDSDDNVSDESDEEQSEEKDRFVAQLYKYMDDSGTPLNNTPTIAGKDIDLHRLFRVVHKMGGYNRVSNQTKWKSVAGRMRVPVNQNAFNQLKGVYKKCLLSYEGFFRTLGVTMSNPARPVKKDKGRSLIRDKNRTPISSPRPERDDDASDKSSERKTPLPIEKLEPKPAKKKPEKEPNTPKKASSDAGDTPSTSGIRPKRFEGAPGSVSKTFSPKDQPTTKKLLKPVQGDKVKVVVEKLETLPSAVIGRKEEKVQFTRSKSLTSMNKVTVTTRQREAPAGTTKPAAVKIIKKSGLEEKKGKTLLDALPSVYVGDKLIVYYGPTNESKVTYEAKVVDIDRDQTGPVYLVHYTGWNTRYDEWIPANRIAENLTSGVKSKKSCKVPAPVNVKPSTSSSIKNTKKSRLSSISSSREDKTPRSTTPSSVTSSGSVAKSPATPVMRSSRLAAKLEAKRRRPSDPSESESSESEAELPRTRSGSLKSEELDLKTYRKRASRGTPKPTQKRSKSEDENESEKSKEKRSRRNKKSSPEESASDEDSNEVKGRDFDLNQIRSELKGFSKALKVPALSQPKETSSSSEDSQEKPPELKKEVTVEVLKIEEEEEEAKLPQPLPSPNSEDIYEFKEPEPFEFETRAKLGEDKSGKKRLPRLFGSLSPGKSESKLDLPEPRTYSRVPKRRHISEDEEEEDLIEEEEEEDEELTGLNIEQNLDPFDKLIESPNFNLVKTSPEKGGDSKGTGLFSDALFKELPETSDEYSRDMELSDCESQTQIFAREDTLFSTAFSKSPPDRVTPDFSSGKTDEGKTTTNSDDEDIQAQIQRVIALSSSTDEDSADLPVVKPEKSPTPPPATPNKIITVLGQAVTAPPEPNVQIKNEDLVEDHSREESPPPSKVEPTPIDPPPAPPSPKKPIDPALQETDSSLLESIVSKPPLILNPKLDDTGKELTVKTGTRIADSILQKFNFIKSQSSATSIKSEISISSATEPQPSTSAQLQVVKEEVKKVEQRASLSPVASTSSVKVEVTECRRKKRVKSKAIIEESDSESSGSENLVIGLEGDDGDSRTSSSNKPLAESKGADSNASLQKTNTTTDDSESQTTVAEPQHSFTFDNILPKDDVEMTPPAAQPCEEIPKELDEAKTEAKLEECEPIKEEPKEEDPALHSLLLCEEEIPRSPAPSSEPSGSGDPPSSTSQVHEMPFASAPGSSKMLLEPPKKLHPPPLLMPPVERAVDAQAVIENTPPTTPESTISNLSPRGDNGNISPNSNDSKSIEGEPGFGNRKVSPYSEEDTQIGGDLPPARKPPDTFGGPPMGYRKRRRSLRNSEDGPSGVPAIKRGRKTRVRRESDSDDASEHSVAGSGCGGTTPGSISSVYERSARSPRPSKYNFFVEFDPSLDSSQRIAVLQQKLQELRKTYADVKAELAAVERRRKKLRRREREALKTSKQDMACS